MQLRYDDDFLEGAVFTCVNRRRNRLSALQVRRFQTARERLYAIPEPEARDKAFFNLHLDWYREWGLETMILGIVNEFRSIRARLDVLVFRKARVSKDEGAELYVSAEKERAGV